MELALVAGAFKAIGLFQVVHSTAKVGAASRQRPTFFFPIKDDKVFGDKIAGRWQGVGDIDEDRFFRDLEANELHNRVQQRQGSHPGQKIPPGPSPWLESVAVHCPAGEENFRISISLTCGGTKSLTLPPLRAASLIIEELIYIQRNPGMRKTDSTSLWSFLFIRAN